jgi:putative PIN family toxin of toxin-antitoxin system
MSHPKTFVFDTSALISAALSNNSISAQAYDHAVRTGVVAVSASLIEEFTVVLFRKKLDRYFVSEEERLEPIVFLENNAKTFEIIDKIVASKDPKDNMILELAVASQASCVVTGDKKHLLTLHPFRGIPIVTPAGFLNMF